MIYILFNTFSTFFTPHFLHTLFSFKSCCIFSLHRMRNIILKCQEESFLVFEIRLFLNVFSHIPLSKHFLLSLSFFFFLAPLLHFLILVFLSIAFFSIFSFFSLHVSYFSHTNCFLSVRPSFIPALFLRIFFHSPPSLPFRTICSSSFPPFFFSLSSFYSFLSNFCFYFFFFQLSTLVHHFHPLFLSLVGITLHSGVLYYFL